MSENSEFQSENEPNGDVECELNKLRLSDANNIVVGHVNINSLSGKFDQLKALITNDIDILVLNETKADETSPPSSFIIDTSSKLLGLDRNWNSGGMLIIAKNDIPSKFLRKHNFPGDIKGLFIELSFRKTKWLFLTVYHTPSQKDQYFFDCIGKALGIFSNYERVTLTGDFNVFINMTCFNMF